MRKNKNLILWIIRIIIYLSFIGFFTYLYPISEDEMLCKVHNLDCVLYLYKNFCARISILFSGTFLFNTYKWGFVILNPIIQSVLVFLIFYLVNLRMPDFKTLKDFPQVVFTALACVFMVAQPDQTIFWFSGATNYLFLGVMFIAFCALMRKTWHTPDLIPSNIFTFIVAVSSGIVLGMNNENSAPMMFCLCALYIFAAIGFKKKIPHWFWFLFTGILAGMAVMFSSPAYFQRMNINIIMQEMNKRPLLIKMESFTNHLDYFMQISLYALPIVILSSLLCLADKFKTAIKDEIFLFTVLSCFVSFMLAFVFFPVSILPDRIFYNATLFTIISILFLVKYLKNTYNIRLMPVLVVGIICFSVIIIIPFSKQYILLHKQNIQRETLLKNFNNDKNMCLWLPIYSIHKMQNTNLSLKFYDPMKGTDGKHMYFTKYYDKDVVSGKEFSFPKWTNTKH